MLYFFLRWIYFDEILPLPFLVKSAGTRDLLIFFHDSLAPVLYLAIPSLAIVFIKRNRREAIALIGCIVIPSLFYMSMRLEQNIGNRFLAPMFFGSLYVLCDSKKIYSVIYISICAFLLSGIFKTTVKGLQVSKKENVFYLAQDLSAIQGKMLVTEAGRLAYYSDWFVHDSWGLNTPQYAKNLVTSKDVIRENYDLINAHCLL